MRTSIFIKTYKKDLVWLGYCLRSLKYFSGEHEVVIVADEDCRSSMGELDLSRVTAVHYVPVPADGYLMQEVIKLQSATYTSGEYILFIDSDTVFTRHVTIDNFLVDGKPEWGKLAYADMINQPYYKYVMGYKKFLERITGWQSNHEYMCRPPHVIRRSTLLAIAERFPDLIGRYHHMAATQPLKLHRNGMLDLDAWLDSSHAFTEFNLMGLFADINEHEQYHWITDPKQLYQTLHCVQHWSWGGLNASVIKQIEQTIEPNYPTSRADLGEFLNARNLIGFGCEIGVAYGAYSEQILKTWRGCTLFCVDPWIVWPEGEYVDTTSKIDPNAMFMETLRRVSKFPGRASLVRQTSDVAATMFPDGFFDWVYVDGNHHEPQISRDLDTWWAKVKLGGLFGGHDYYNVNTPEYRCDVKSAVDAFVQKHSLYLRTTMGEGDKSWWVIK